MHFIVFWNVAKLNVLDFPKPPNNLDIQTGDH